MNVLVIDDDQVVCSVVHHILERNNHTVILASSGADGMAAFKKHHETVDMAIIDVCLPDTGGVKLLRKIRRIEPNLPCLVCSGIGGALDDIPEDLREQTNFLRKPFLSENLIRAVSKITVLEPD